MVNGNRVIADFVAYARIFFRSREAAFFTFAFPIILILIFGAIFSTSGSAQVTIYVQDEDDTPLSAQFISALNSTKALSIKMLSRDINLTDFITKNTVNVALTIPKEFENHTLKAVDLSSLGRNVTGSTSVLIIRVNPASSSSQVASGVVGAVASQFSQALTHSQSVISLERAPLTEATKRYEYIDFFLPGVMALTALTTPLFAMLSITGEYKITGKFKLLATTPITKLEWLLSKCLWNVFIITVSAFIIFAVGLVAFQLKVTLTVAGLVLLATSTLLFSALGMALGVFVKQQETASVVGNVISFPQMFIAGTFFPIDQMPDYLQMAANFLPLKYLNDGLRASMTFANDGLAYFNAAGILVISLALFIVSVRALSWKAD